MANVKEERHKELWYDADKNKHYILQNGKHLDCDVTGKRNRHFVHYCTGSLNYKDRLNSASRTRNFRLVPARPPSLSDLRLLLKSNQLRSKLGENSQVRRQVLCKMLSRPNKSRNAPTSIQPLKMETVQNFALFSTMQGPPSTRNVSSRNQVSSCMFLTARSMYSSKIPTPPRLQSKGRLETSGLPKPDLMLGSTLKSGYCKAVRGTFTTCRNLNRMSETTRRLLAAEDTFAERSNVDDIAPKPYREVRLKLEREERDSTGYQEPSHNSLRIIARGVYPLHLPTENDLYARALLRRQMQNPDFFSQTSRKEAFSRDHPQGRNINTDTVV